AGAAAVAGLGAVGDPFVGWSTLTGSFRDLAQSVGQMLSPMLVELSANLQGAAAWVRGRGGSSRTTASRWLAWFTGRAMTAAMLLRVASAVNTLTLGMHSLRAATFPVLGVFGIALTVAAALGAELLVMGDRASDAAKKLGAVAGEATGLKAPKNQLA